MLRQVGRAGGPNIYDFVNILTLRPDAAIFGLVSAVSSSDRRFNSNDEDQFRINPGRVRARADGRALRTVRPRPKTFRAEVHQSIRCTGGDPDQLGSAGRGRDVGNLDGVLPDRRRRDR